jgi:hypothetical protein
MINAHDDGDDDAGAAPWVYTYETFSLDVCMVCKIEGGRVCEFAVEPSSSCQLVVGFNKGLNSSAQLKGGNVLQQDYC